MIRRTQLMQAAGIIFKKKGYKGTSVNDIAGFVGIDRATFYYYTSGKDEIFRELVHDAVLENVRIAEKICNGSDKPKEKIHKLIVALMKSFESHFPYLYVYVQEDMAQIARKNKRWTNDMKRLNARFEAALATVIQGGLEDGSLVAHGGNARLISLGLIGMCNWSHRWFEPTGEMSAESIGEVFARLVLEGFQRR